MEKYISQQEIRRIISDIVKNRSSKEIRRYIPLMRIILKYTLFVLMLMPLPIFSKPVTQEGVAYLYDYKTKTKKPLAGVSFTIADTEPTKSNTNGCFTLCFMTQKKGSKIINIRQPFFKGLKVFNKKDVDDWYIVDGKLELIMCDYEEFELVKKTYYEQGKKDAEKKYRKRQKELEDALNANKLRESEYEQQLQELRESYQHTLDNLSNSADAMARIDQSKLSLQMQEVLDLYEQGKVDKAMEMLSSLQLAESLEQSIKQKEQSKKAYEQALQDSIMAVKNIRSAIQLCENNEEWEKVERYRWTLANHVGTPHELFEYAYFCQNHILYRDSAETYYLRVLNATKESQEWYLYHLYLYATTMNNLGVIYEGKHLYSEAYQAYIMGLKGRKRYAKLSNNRNEENHVAWTLVTLANFCINRGRYEDGEAYLNEAFDIYSKIKTTFFDGNEWTYGRFYDTKGWLCVKTNRIEDAERYYQKSIELYGKSVGQNPFDHIRSMIHITIWGLFPVYQALNHPEKNEEIKNKIINLINKYEQTDPKVHSLLSEFYYAISNYYLDKNRIDDWISCRLEWFEISLNDIETKRKGAYDVNMDDVLMELHNQKRYRDCIKISMRHLAFYREMLNRNSIYKNAISKELCNLSYYVIFQKDYIFAEKNACEALELNPYDQLPQTNLAAALLFQGKYSEAETVYRQFKPKYKKEMLEDLETFDANGVVPKEREADVEKIKKLLTEE